VRNWHPLSKLSVLLGLAGLGVLWLTDHEVASGTDRVAVVPTSLAASGATAGLVEPPLAAVPRSRSLPAVDAFAAMVERPLFASDRRPFDPTVESPYMPPVDWEPAPAAGPEAPHVTFIGSIEENGVVRAFLSDGYAVRGVGLGQDVDGWAVVAIDTRRLVLAHDEQRLELTILE